MEIEPVAWYFPTMTKSFSLSNFPIHLGLGATCLQQPKFTGDMQWYGDYGQRNASDGLEGRLVSMHTFSQPWDSWEMHPKGSELVICTSGTITITQQIGGEDTKVVLQTGDAIVNPPGIWHTADVTGVATAIFITAGVGTEMKPRQ